MALRMQLCHLDRGYLKFADFYKNGKILINREKKKKGKKISTSKKILKNKENLYKEVQNTKRLFGRDAGQGPTHKPQGFWTMLDAQVRSTAKAAGVVIV